MPSKPDHVGEWKGVDSQGKQTSLILNGDNSAILINGNEVLGGVDFKLEDKKINVRYEVDYERDPIWLDLVFYGGEEDKEMGRLFGIVRFLTETKIEYRISDVGNPRYYEFDSSDKDRTLVLDKVVN
jgi:hypothetical protein